jgi:hypothetical protein
MCSCEGESVHKLYMNYPKIIWEPFTGTSGGREIMFYP